MRKSYKHAHYSPQLKGMNVVVMLAFPEERFFLMMMMKWWKKESGGQTQKDLAAGRQVLKSCRPRDETTWLSFDSSPPGERYKGNFLPKLSSFSELQTMAPLGQKFRKGPYLDDVCNFDFLTPLIPCPQLVLICSIEFTQPPSRPLLFGYNHPPLSVDVI